MKFDYTTTAIVNLLINQAKNGKNFQKNIRSYNNSLAIASMSTNIDHFKGNDPYFFKNNGMVYHVSCSLRPATEERLFVPKF